MTFFIMFMLVFQTEGSECPLGWFGPQCELKCYCKSDKCTESGECDVDFTCEPGLFGSQCQYLDLTSNKSSTTYSWLNDGDDETCNDGFLNSDQITITTDVEFTWARIVVKDPEHLQDITIEFQEKTPCMGMKSFTISDRMRDVVCLNYTTVTSVILKGKGVHSLCSFYISGGRNVALKQYANLSSVLFAENWSAASAAVDGDRGQDYNTSRCVHSGLGDNKPTLMISFGNYAQQINRVVIYNRLGPSGQYVKDLTRGFLLTLWDMGEVIAQYKDQTSMTHTIYIIRFSEKQPVRYLTIEALKIAPGQSSKFINLCEVEVYGEIVCPVGKYGLGCDQSCGNCFKNDCFVSTGGCFSGCAPGKVPPDCIRNCVSGHYGMNCSNKCPDNCHEEKCEPVFGACSRGCLDGYMGKHCEIECHDGFYGHNCSKACPEQCLNNTCQPDTGACTNGCTEDFDEHLKLIVAETLLISVFVILVLTCCCWVISRIRKKPANLGLEIPSGSKSSGRRVSSVESDTSISTVSSDEDDKDSSPSIDSN